jgi:hypothetical protein
MVRWLVVLLVVMGVGSSTHAQSSALPQRWILAGDSIQAQVFANAELGLTGGDARDLTAAIIMQDTGITVQNVSSPGARLTTASFFPGLTHGLQSRPIRSGLSGPVVHHPRASRRDPRRARALMMERNALSVGLA